MITTQYISKYRVALAHLTIQYSQNVNAITQADLRHGPKYHMYMPSCMHSQMAECFKLNCIKPDVFITDKNQIITHGHPSTQVEEKSAKLKKNQHKLLWKRKYVQQMVC